MRKTSKVLIISFCFLVTSCGQDIDTGILGKWRGLTAKQDLTFYEDGRVEMKGHNHGTYMGRYSIANRNDLTCSFERLSKPIKCKAKIWGKELILSFPSGRKEKYKRKK